MRFKLLFPIITLTFLKFISGNDSESSEIKRIEITPYHDTVVFSDVIDIINELNRDFNTRFDIANSDSESDENVEDLLSEYQHYLDKAHEQRRAYLAKLNQTKNKVPLLRRDSYTKTNQQPIFEKYDYYNANSYYKPGIFKIPPTTYNNPLDLFIPINSPMRYFNNPIHDTAPIQKIYDGEFPRAGNELGEKKLLTIPTLLQKTFKDRVKSSCICPPSEIPCKCVCKHCLVPSNFTNNSLMKSKLAESNGGNQILLDPRVHELDESDTANTINVKIKVDIQLPKNLEMLANNNNQQHSHDSAVEYEDMSREPVSSIKLPTTSYNLPIPLHMFQYKQSKINRHDSTPFQKITIHKKKKSRSRFGNNIKRHRKKVITFHNVKVSTPQTMQLFKEFHNGTIIDVKKDILNETNNIEERNVRVNNIKSNNYNFTSTNPPIIKNITQLEDTVESMVNISNNNDNQTEEAHNSGNSIELELGTNSNMSAINMREKRFIAKPMQDSSSLNENNNTVKQETNSPMLTHNAKKSDKAIISDAYLLFWPNISQNNYVAKVDNITEVILQTESKKVKLNISKEAFRNNRTTSLEHAIFGQVDWNDMDTIVPTFITFVGKYINGMLTLCSEKMCHSIKCEEKACIHRTCSPEQRFNHIGHCSGSKESDSIASMESIVDLPSNIPFEIVDILQENMLGKLYGKVTLCISSKCITFIAFKKTFVKSKCVRKTLSKTGHCPNKKNRK